MGKITVTLEDRILEVKAGTKLIDICRIVHNNECQKRLIVAARVNNELKELTYEINESSKIKFFDLTTEVGMRIYVRSLSLVFIRATKEIIPDCEVSIEHSLSKGLYCEVKGKKLTINLVKKIEKRMREIVSADERFEKKKVTKEEAMDLFAKEGQTDKVEMLKYLTNPKGSIYRCGWLSDFFYGYLAPSTGYLQKFALQFYLPGIIIQYPLTKTLEIPEFIPQPKLASIFREAEQWGDIMEVNTVAALNNFITTNRIGQLIRVAEALHEKKIASIADLISNNKERGNIVLIAGPSSSGKTTFIQRLKIQLMVNGLKPVTISVDDYFVERERTPKDEIGEYDFEALEAIDTEVFNDHLSKLIQGQEVEIPTFNFKKGCKEFLGNKLKLGTNQLILIEGIHGLNEKLTYSIPKEHKFKIYISALTQLNIDKHNRIPTTDTRKIRRMIRDNEFRGTKPINTIKHWNSVRRGEEKNIFPFQEEADVMFNSALVYELAVLKPLAEPLLKSIGPENEEYLEAQRLLKFLSYFLPIGLEEIPKNSIIGEFLGRGCF